MKHNWEYKKLGEVCVSKSGIGRALKTFESNDEILYIDIASIDNQKHSITSYTQTKLSEAPSRAQQCVKKEDILVSLVRPNLKNVAIVGDDENNLVASSGFCVLRAGEDLLPQYVFQFVCSDKFTDYLVGLTAGANYPAVREDDVRNAIVPVPPLEEQSRIVAELDLLTGIIDKQNAQLKELDNLAQAIFYDMFGDPIENPKGWEIKKLGDVSTSVSYGTSSPSSTVGKYKYLRMNNITYEGFLDLTDLKYIDMDDAEFEKYSVREGDVLFNRTNSMDLIGKTTYIHDMEPMIIAGYIIRVRLADSVLPVYVSKFMNTPAMKKKLRGMAKGAVNQANINSKELKNIDIPLPPLALQQSFAEKIQSIENQKAKIKASIVETQKLLDYTMDKYFG